MKNWEILGRIAIVVGIIVGIYSIIPKKNWARINNSYITNFESYNVPNTVLYKMFYEISEENDERVKSKVWNQYASAIISIYEAISPRATLHINDTIEGRISGHKRRVDLTLRQEVAGQDIFIAFILYPWKSRITIPELNSYRLLIEDINASKGVLIINQQIDSSLIDFAKRNSISLCTLKDSESKKWNEEIEIPVYWVQITPRFNLKSIARFEANDKTHKDITRWQFSYNYGIETFTLLDYLNYKWTNNEIPHTTDSLHILYLDTKNLKLMVNTDEWREVSKFEVYYTTDENYWMRYYEPERYRAIEDYITHDIEFSEIDLTFGRFNSEDTTDWIRIDEKDFDLNKLKGISIVATANARQFSSENVKTNSMGIWKVE